MECHTRLSGIQLFQKGQKHNLVSDRKGCAVTACFWSGPQEPQGYGYLLGWVPAWLHRAGSVRTVHATKYCPCRRGCVHLWAAPHHSHFSHLITHQKPQAILQWPSGAPKPLGWSCSRERVLRGSLWVGLVARSEDNTPESLNYTFKWPHTVLNSARARQLFFSKILY